MLCSATRVISIRKAARQQCFVHFNNKYVIITKNENSEINKSHQSETESLVGDAAAE